MASELCNLTVHELSTLLAGRKVSAVEALESVMARIESVDGSVNAYITKTYELARSQAMLADERLARADAGPLTGVPLAIKDILCTRAVRTTCGSRMLENFVPAYDATVIERLRGCGAVFAGKTSMDEFAMGSSNETAYFGPVHNPWDLDRVPGGSSGGSAAAVAADCCIAALGTDTGGSIRQPASLCGVVGLKPTYGRVSRFGLIAFASSLDQIGPITKDVQDAALLLSAISGYDPKDSTSVRRDVPDYTRVLKQDIRGLRLGIPEQYFIRGLDPEVEKAVQAAIEVLKAQGARIVPISLPHTEYAVAVYYLIAPAEACSNLARYDGVKYGYRSSQPENLRQMYEQSRSEGFGAEVKRRIMLGTYALSAGYYDAYYKKASQLRTLIRQDFTEAFKLCDLIVTPTAPAPAFRLGEKLSDPLSMYLSDIFTIPTNLAGLPGISLPCGFSAGGLPIGLQIIGDFFAEERILQAAYSYEQSTRWHLQKPPLLSGL